jgi:hypothetical protein
MARTVKIKRNNIQELIRMADIGRPKLFNTPEEMADRIDNYFNSITITKPCWNNVIIGYEDEEKRVPIYKQEPILNNNGEQITKDTYFEHPSVIALAHYLEMDRRSLLNYEKDPLFFPTIKKAKEKIELYLEYELYRGQGQVAGIVFNLKNNFDWKDKQEIDQNINLNSKLEDFIK